MHKASFRFPSLCAGAGVVVQPGDRVLPNNSLITTSSNNVIPQFQCLSGSLRTSVGKLIGPLGTDITFKNSDPFNVRRRGAGTLLVFSSSNAMETDDNGIYTFRTPDENGDTVDFHFGMYTLQYAGMFYFIEQLHHMQSLHSSGIYTGFSAMGGGEERDRV